MKITVFKLKRILRNFRSIISYPIWIAKGKPAPDNNLYKNLRLKRYITMLKIDAVIETGTFYGQTVNYLKEIVDQIISIEIYEPFFLNNSEIFKKNKHIKIEFGDSSEKLMSAIKQCNGKILFWLDGHYSGTGTGIGNKVSPIIEELIIIKNSGRKDICVIVDDIRLFDGSNGYPTTKQALEIVREINPIFNIHFDHDCLIAYE
jgi:hypothetical protein